VSRHLYTQWAGPSCRQHNKLQGRIAVSIRRSNLFPQYYFDGDFEVADSVDIASFSTREANTLDARRQNRLSLLSGRFEEARKGPALKRSPIIEAYFPDLRAL